MYFNREFVNTAFDTAQVHVNGDGTKEKKIRIGTIYCGFDEYGTYLSIDQDGDVYAVRPVFD